MIPKLSAEGQLLSRPKTYNTMSVDKHKERTMVRSLTNSYKFKLDGLMKKVSLTFFGFVSKDNSGPIMNIDFFFDYWRRVPASNFILQDRRYREWSESSQASLFSARAGFARY